MSSSIEMSAPVHPEQNETLLDVPQSAPNHRVEISWQNISVSTRQTKKFCCRKSKPSIPILKSVSGKAEAGKVLAVMGPSGSGKTTLLNVLTGRNLANYEIEGSVLLNGQPLRNDVVKSMSGFVQQGTLFVPMLTVKEYLIFQSLVRMDRKMTAAQRNERIVAVMCELGLSKCADSRIGNRYDDLVGSGISGGELRRLAFAAEILTNPPILICDEPTSGLDSYLAESVVKILTNLARSGRTVICTIHQPSSHIFFLFDRLLLLTDGRLAFHGSLPDAQQHFSSLDLPCPSNFNPADHYLHLISIEPGNEAESQKRIERICDSFDHTSASSNVAGKQQPAEAGASSNLQNEDVELQFANKKMPTYMASWCEQFRALLWRSQVTNLREPMITKVKLTQTVAVAFLMGNIYWRQQLDQKGIMNINGAIFVLLINLTFMNIFSVINTFCSELSIFLREHNDGMYRVDTYFLAKQVAELPFQILLPTIFVLIQYYMIGLNDSIEALLMFVLISNLVANCGISFGYLISCSASSTKMAIATASPLVLPILLFGGFFINNSSVQRGFATFKYLSWFYYGNEALMITQWKSIDHIACPPPSASINDSAHAEHRCLRNGLSVIEEYSFQPDHISFDIVRLLALIIGMRILAFISLLQRSKRR